MEKTQYPEHLVGIVANAKRAAARECEVWGRQDILADFSFTKTTNEAEAHRVLNKFMRRFCRDANLHLSLIIYADEQPNRRGCWHFHTYIKVLDAPVDVDDIYKLLKRLQKAWFMEQGISSTREQHPVFNGQVMDTRIANYIQRSATPYNAHYVNDATGMAYRVSGHKTDDAVDRIICPRHKSKCRKNKCEFSTSTMNKPNGKRGTQMPTERSVQKHKGLSAR